MIGNALWVTDPLRKCLGCKLEIVMLISFFFKLFEGMSIIEEELSTCVTLVISIDYERNWFNIQKVFSVVISTTKIILFRNNIARSKMNVDSWEISIELKLLTFGRVVVLQDITVVLHRNPITSSSWKV